MLRNHLPSYLINKIKSYLSLVLLFLILNELITPVQCVRFMLESDSKRCLKEEMRHGVMAFGEYELTESLGQRTDIQITDSKGHHALNRENIDKGKFGVTSDEDDYYDICFISYRVQGPKPSPREVYLEVKHGSEGRNYDEIAQVSKLKPLEVELTKLEDLSSSIVLDFELMKKREEEMRDTNESTNNRVLYLSVFSMFCLLGLATWQVLYLRKFFKTKKLIE